MSRLKSFVLLLASLVAVTAISGCARETAGPSTDAPTSAAPTASEDDELAELSEEDRAAAIAQDVCPVSGEKLGSMGKPPKVTVDGQEVFLCCAGCEEKLRSDPDTYLKKLSKN